ncbi:MAG: hypothetical protein HY652_09950, partial [Acidobacteria bacterium]|nr:hypothetical protein [Acidobacteriota bacterium]
IVCESPVSNVTDLNYAFLQGVIARLGGKIHCRFLRNARVEEIRLLKKAALNILANCDAPSLTVREYLEKRFGLTFLDEPWPVGFRACERWTLRLGEILGRAAAARACVEEKRGVYEELREGLKAYFRGIRVLVAAYEGQLDWVLEMLADVGAEVVKIGLFQSCQNEFLASWARAVPVESDYSSEKRLRDIGALRPDLVLTNYVPREIPGGVGVAALPLQPQGGFCGALAHARRWALAIHPLSEGWRLDYGRFHGK